MPAEFITHGRLYGTEYTLVWTAPTGDHADWAIAPFTKTRRKTTANQIKICIHVDEVVGCAVALEVLGPDFTCFIQNLQMGTNTITVEVTNIAANRIRDLDRRGIEWRKFHDINLVNLDYEPFDASGWTVRKAGLLGPVKIVDLNESL